METDQTIHELLNCCESLLSINTDLLGARVLAVIHRILYVEHNWWNKIPHFRSVGVSRALLI